MAGVIVVVMIGGVVGADTIGLETFTVVRGVVVGTGVLGIGAVVETLLVSLIFLLPLPVLPQLPVQQ